MNELEELKRKFDEMSKSVKRCIDTIETLISLEIVQKYHEKTGVQILTPNMDSSELRTMLLGEVAIELNKIDRA